MVRNQSILLIMHSHKQPDSGPLQADTFSQIGQRIYLGFHSMQFDQGIPNDRQVSHPFLLVSHNVLYMMGSK